MPSTLSLQDRQELLFYAYKAFTSSPDAMLMKRGWSRSHHRIMHFVAREPGITVSGVLEKLKISKQALHSPLKTLIQANIIFTKESDHDRRVKQLYLTEEGAQLESALSKPQLALLERAFEHCTKDDLAGWQNVLNAIIEAEKE